MKNNFTHRSLNIKLSNGTLEYSLDMARFNRNLSKGQFELDSDVLNDSIKFMPFRTGILAKRARNATKCGSGTIVFPGPESQYLYHGKLMVSPTNGSSYSLPGEKKILTTTDLTFDKTFNPQAGPKWFEVARKRFRSVWIKKLKRNVGGGK